MAGDPPEQRQPDPHQVEIFIDGVWHPGELLRAKVVDGVEVHTVRYVDPEGQTRLDDFPAGLVRPDVTGPGGAR